VPSQQIHSSDDVKVVAAMWMVSQCGGIEKAKETLQRLEAFADGPRRRGGRRTCGRSLGRRKQREG
jgi:hypothetical protein